jgi:hypothetical protein
VSAILGKIVNAVGFAVANDIRDRVKSPLPRISASEAMKIVYGSEMQQIKAVLGIGARGGSESRIDLSDERCGKLATEYEQLHEHWKKVCRNSKNEKNWRAYAKIDEQDSPNDLLDRLDESVEQAPSNEDYPNIPSVLALEHAARRCGIPENEYSSSRLKHLRQRGIQFLANSKP